jgi:transposase
MTRLRGRAQRGKRVHAAAPCGHWRTTTMISSIRLDGTTACMTIGGATDTAVFRTYVERVLCPSLKQGDIVIMDNLAPHKNAATLELIAKAGAESRFLPPYSPDLNPIEKMWSKLKASLRKSEARTVEELDDAIAAALDKVTAKDARGWFASCGYSFV